MFSGFQRGRLFKLLVARVLKQKPEDHSRDAAEVNSAGGGGKPAFTTPVLSVCDSEVAP